MRAPFARMIVKVKRRSGSKKKQGSPVGPPAVVRRWGPPAAPTRPAAGGAGAGP